MQLPGYRSRGHARGGVRDLAPPLVAADVTPIPPDVRGGRGGCCAGGRVALGAQSDPVHGAGDGTWQRGTVSALIPVAAESSVVVRAGDTSGASPVARSPALIRVRRSWHFVGSTVAICRCLRRGNGWRCRVGCSRLAGGLRGTVREHLRRILAGVLALWASADLESPTSSGYTVVVCPRLWSKIHSLSPGRASTSPTNPQPVPSICPVGCISYSLSPGGR